MQELWVPDAFHPTASPCSTSPRPVSVKGHSSTRQQGQSPESLQGPPSCSLSTPRQQPCGFSKLHTLTISPVPSAIRASISQSSPRAQAESLNICLRPFSILTPVGSMPLNSHSGLISPLLLPPWSRPSLPVPGLDSPVQLILLRAGRGSSCRPLEVRACRRGPRLCSLSSSWCL